MPDPQMPPDMPELDVTYVSVVWGRKGYDIVWDEDRMSEQEAYAQLRLGLLAFEHFLLHGDERDDDRDDEDDDRGGS